MDLQGPPSHAPSRSAHTQCLHPFTFRLLYQGRRLTGWAKAGWEEAGKVFIFSRDLILPSVIHYAHGHLRCWPGILDMAPAELLQVDLPGSEN